MALPVLYAAGAGAKTALAVGGTAASGLLIRNRIKKKAYFKKPAIRNAGARANSIRDAYFTRNRTPGTLSDRLKSLKNLSEHNSQSKESVKPSESVKSSDKNDGYNVRIKNYNIVRYNSSYNRPYKKKSYKKKSYKNKYKKGGRK